MKKIIQCPLQAQLVKICVDLHAPFLPQDVLFILEAMKMEHEIRAEHAGVLTEIFFKEGEWLNQGDMLANWQASTISSQAEHVKAADLFETLAPKSAKASDINSVNNTASPSLANPTFLDVNSRSSTPTTVPTVQGLPNIHRQLAQAAFVLNQAVGQHAIRPELQRLHQRQALLSDTARPEAVKKRSAMGKRTARANIADLSDGSFTEYGGFAIAAQTNRRAMEELMEQTPADGLITGLATVNTDCFDESRCKVAVMAYDATVLAGTQGFRNHQKTDRIVDLALAQQLPLVLFAEGGGGRPGDVDYPVVAGLHVASFAKFAALNGRVPLVGITTGRCFAGNAALLGCCDVIIATEDSNIGMGGPVMIEGGGLGVFTPEQIGPSQVQHANGVIDVLVQNESQAVQIAKQYLAFFQGRFNNWQEPNTGALRDFLPLQRNRVYHSDKLLDLVADEHSVLMLRTGFGKGIHIALGRIKGQAVGFMVNNPMHLGGAIDPDAADKAARFMQLCNAHGLPIVSFIDTPGFMVGPEVEARAQVRHTSRMFIAAAHLRVPLIAIIVRKAYGLGAMSMTAGGFHMPVATLAWPTAECGGMGIEGAVRLGYKKELAALPEGPAREALFEQLVAQAIEKGSALSMAMHLEIDDVIDPAHTRQKIHELLLASKIKAFPSNGQGMIDAF